MHNFLKFCLNWEKCSKIVTIWGERCFIRRNWLSRIKITTCDTWTRICIPVNYFYSFFLFVMEAPQERNCTSTFYATSSIGSYIKMTVLDIFPTLLMMTTTWISLIAIINISTNTLLIESFECRTPDSYF